MARRSRRRSSPSTSWSTRTTSGPSTRKPRPVDVPGRHRARRMTFALQARGISKSFGGVEVLHGVDLDAVGGSVLALLGENGAGKSTLVKIIAGDYTPDAGEMVVDGVSHTVLTPRQA